MTKASDSSNVLARHAGDDAAAPLTRWRLTSFVRSSETGPVLDREPVAMGDFDLVMAEMWFHGHLRKGRPDCPFDEVEVMMVPVYSPNGDDPRVIAGYDLETASPDQTTYRRRFTTSSLPWASDRAARRLLKIRRLKDGDTYAYTIHAEAGQGDTAPSGPSDGLTVRVKDPPLRWLEIPLSALLDGATEIGPQDRRWSHVFMTREARAKVERYSRLGGREVPATETGAALLGTLAVCPNTNDMFVIVTDAIQVIEAESTTLSLEYTSQSWTRINAVVRAKQQQPATSTWRMLGQGHGHNFLPANGATPCAACAKAPVCGRTSAFVSTQDLNWTRAVFARQPYALSHIFGLSARHLRPDPDVVDVLYGISDGRLLARGYHLIDGFDPARWARPRLRAEPQEC